MKKVVFVGCLFFIFLTGCAAVPNKQVALDKAPAIGEVADKQEPIRNSAYRLNKKYLKYLKFCYRRYSDKAEAFFGKALVVVNTTDQGMVQSVVVETGGSEFNYCMQKVIKRWKFEQKNQRFNFSISFKRRN